MLFSKGATVVVGMSGGVDSSVAALLLKKQNYNVVGLFMKNWEEDDTDIYCHSKNDFKDAKAVADALDIPLHSVNFAKEYWDKVFEHFLSEYESGRTPNPDILCNKEIKFKAFLEYALHLGADAIATGHYAKKHQTQNGFALHMASDRNKDQSYFLYTITQSILSKTLFPLSDYTKPEIRAIAKEYGLATHQKKDSTGICFIGERKFKTFLERYLPAKPGLIQSDTGQILGQHPGLMYFTLGQRQGIGIGGQANCANHPWYVIEKDLARNRLIVAAGKDHPKLKSKTLYAKDLTFVSGQAPKSEQAPNMSFECQAKIRYRHPGAQCQVVLKPDNTALVTFNEPERAITPGQAIVFYDDEVCLGGGTIVEAE